MSWSRSSSPSTVHTDPEWHADHIKDPVRTEPLWWWNCWRQSEKMCWKRLRRPHLTCFNCWIRRMHGGLMPVDLRCTEIRILVWKDRPGAGWKRRLLKPMLSIVESLSR